MTARSLLAAPIWGAGSRGSRGLAGAISDNFGDSGLPQLLVPSGRQVGGLWGRPESRASGAARARGRARGRSARPGGAFPQLLEAPARCASLCWNAGAHRPQALPGRPRRLGRSIQGSHDGLCRSSEASTRGRKVGTSVQFVSPWLLLQCWFCPSGAKVDSRQAVPGASPHRDDSVSFSSLKTQVLEG